jgi:glycine cleavage system H lipoate-binding protein
MFGHDPYAARAVEYLLGLAFLLLFAAFWRYAAGTAVAKVERVAAPARRALPFGDMFQVPAGVLFHPGHAWARADGPGLVTIGVDDFAQQLVGRMGSVITPDVGTLVEQGMPVATLRADSKGVGLLSPISGQVVDVNDEVKRRPNAINDDPYGRGWLIKVRTPRWPVDSKQLLHGSLARRWMSSSWDDLTAMMSPELGTTMHDGGMPVQGLARAIDAARWDEIAARFLLSGNARV